MTYTYIEGDLDHSSGPNGIVTRVVMHATVSPCQTGGARATARYFQSSKAGGLAHFVVDPGEIIQCAPETLSTWHAPPNKGSLGIELCDPQKGDAARWHDVEHEAMLHLAARLVVDLTTRHSIPRVFVNADGLLAGHHGITTHHEVTKAWHKSTHTDPDAGGPFPLAHFMQLVTAAATPPHRPAAVTPSWWKRPLKLGDTGLDVKGAQTHLGFTGSMVDGIYGPHTEAAVRARQVRAHLRSTGVLDAPTARAIG